MISSSIAPFNPVVKSIESQPKTPIVSYSQPGTNWPAGQLLSVCHPIGDSQWVGQYGLIYQTVTEQKGAYVAVMLDNGEDLGLLQVELMPVHFVAVPVSPAVYTFSDAATLMADFSSGLFDDYFSDAQTYDSF